MKKKIFFYPFLLITMAFTYKLADDIITRLGMEHQNAQWHIIRNFIGRYDTGPMELAVEDGPANSVYKQLQSFQIPRAKLLPSIIAGDKGGAAREVCVYVKNYANSEEFAAEYIKLKEDAMPLTDRGMSMANLKRSKEVHQKNINNYKTDAKYVAEQQKELDEVEKRIVALAEAAKKPFPGKDAWLKLYPADPAVMVKARLQEYLQLAATVDFSAKLTGSGKKQTFVNPVYEKKSLKWKAIYRAGKEVNDVVTAFIKEWLKGEIIAKEKSTMSAVIQDNKSTTVTTSTIPANQNKTNTVMESSQQSSTPVLVQADTTNTKSTQKKGGLKKLKDKIGTIINN